MLGGIATDGEDLTLHDEQRDLSDGERCTAELAALLGCTAERPPGNMLMERRRVNSMNHSEVSFERQAFIEKVITVLASTE